MQMLSFPAKEPYLINQAYSKLSLLSFARIKAVLQDSEEGEAWTSEQCESAELEYKRFLALKFAYPNDVIIPNYLADKFWHYHSLDPQTYLEDCQSIFGFIINRPSYFGNRRLQDIKIQKQLFTTLEENTMGMVT